jgi:hypothetical protein
MPEWLAIVIPSVFGGGAFAAILVFVATRKRDKDTAVSERFDDAKEIAALIKAEVETAVAAATKPLIKRVTDLELAVTTLTAEARNLHDGIREWASRLWIWNRTGRPGNMPGPPQQLRESVDLGYLLEDTEPIEPGHFGALPIERSDHD